MYIIELIKQKQTRKLIFIPELCTGCRECELMCSLFHNSAYNLALARIKVEYNRQSLHSHVVFCHHCKDPSCVKACKHEAMIQDTEAGTVSIDSNKCKKCLNCVNACINNAIQIDPDGGPLKCDLCGGDPVCVKFCSKRPQMSSPYMKNRQNAQALIYVANKEKAAHLTKFQQICCNYYQHFKNELLNNMMKAKMKMLARKAKKVIKG